MAASSSNLTTQLESKLSDKNDTLSSRLEVAFKVFASSEIPIVQKEEYIIAWVLQTLSESSKDDEKELLFSFLLKCFQCSRFQNFNGHMKSDVINELFAALKHIEDNPGSLMTIKRNCCVEMVRVPFFQRWFMCDPENMSKITAYYLKSVSDSTTAADFSSFIDDYLYIHKMSLLKEEMRTYFAKEILRPLCEALSIIPVFFEKAIVLFREVFFYEPKFLDNYINSKITEDEPMKEVKSFSKKLKHLPTKVNKKVVETCYSLFLKSVISKYPDEYEKIFRVFSSLCPALGIVVNRMFSIEMNPVDENWEIDYSFEIIEKLIAILEESQIPLTLQLDATFNLQNWFTSLVIGMSHLNYKRYSNNFLKMVKKVYEFNPLVIEPSCKVITMIMLQIKDPNVKTSYIELIRSVLSGSIKVQRLQKFIAFFLENMRSHLLSWPCEDNLLLDDVIPEKLYYDFPRAFAALPSMQVLATLRSFIFHLQRDCINSLESNPDKALVINCGVICELLTLLLLSANIVDHSVPDTVKAKYKLMLEDLQVPLHQMGLAFHDLHEDSLLIPFLKLCRAFGEIKLLFREYDNIEIVAPMAVDLEPTNVSYVHNYLGPEEWKKIAQTINEHLHCQAANSFYELLIQKVGALSQVEEGLEGPGTQVARYLLTSADTQWLWEKVLILAPQFQSPQLIKLISKIIRYLGDDQSEWLPLLQEEALTENRRLVLGLGFGLMHRASKKVLRSPGESEAPISRQILSLFRPGLLLEYELSQLVTDDEELAFELMCAVSEVISILNENLPVLHIPPEEGLPPISFLEVPARLPLHHLSALSQSCVLYSAIALLYDIPPGSPADNLLFNLMLKILDGPQKGNLTLPNDFRIEFLLSFVAERGENFRGQRKLMKRICAVAFRSKKSAKHIFCAVGEPTAADAWVTALVIDCLVQLKKKHVGLCESGRPLERKKCLDKLMSILLPVLCSEPPSPSNLYTFTVMFSHTLRYLSSYQVPYSRLLPLLPEYINFALVDYSEGERLVECLVEHRSELGEHFPPVLILSAFEQMKIQVIPPTDSTSHLLFGAATSQEFNTIIHHALNEVKMEELLEGGQESRRLLLLWAQLLSGLLSGEKSRVREEMLVKLMETLVSVLEHWSSRKGQYLVQPFMTIISVLAKNSGITLRNEVLDCCFLLCGEVPLPSDDRELLLANLSPLLDALHSLFRYRTALLTDRLPVFLQQYRRCLVSLAPVVSNSAPYSFVKKAVPVANKIERLSTAMVKKSKDFSRLAPYLIADLMNVFQNHNIYYEVKFVYDNVVNSFLSISDKHAISFLKGILPTGQQELFDRSYEKFNKFHRFVGKI